MGDCIALMDPAQRDADIDNGKSSGPAVANIAMAERRSMRVRCLAKASGSTSMRTHRQAYTDRSHRTNTETQLCRKSGWNHTEVSIDSHRLPPPRNHDWRLDTFDARGTEGLQILSVGLPPSSTRIVCLCWRGLWPNARLHRWGRGFCPLLLLVPSCRNANAGTARGRVAGRRLQDPPAIAGCGMFSFLLFIGPANPAGPLHGENLRCDDPTILVLAWTGVVDRYNRFGDQG